MRLLRWEALNTALPIGVRQVETMRTTLTQSLAVLMSFNVQELIHSIIVTLMVKSYQMSKDV